MKTNRGRNSSTSWIRKSTREAIYHRDGDACVYCLLHRSVTRITLDHLKPTSRGGTHHPTNLVTACLRCNSKRRDGSVRDCLRNNGRVEIAEVEIAEVEIAYLARRIYRNARKPLDRAAGRARAA